MNATIGIDRYNEVIGKLKVLPEIRLLGWREQSSVPNTGTFYVLDGWKGRRVEAVFSADYNFANQHCTITVYDLSRDGIELPIVIDWGLDYDTVDSQQSIDNFVKDFQALLADYHKKSAPSLEVEDPACFFEVQDSGEVYRVVRNVGTLKEFPHTFVDKDSAREVASFLNDLIREGNDARN